eukprot:158604_1
MSAEFEAVKSQANKEYAYSRAKLTYDLAHRNRFMPAPFNVFAFYLTLIIHILNFIPALILPRQLNIYYHIETGPYDLFRGWKIFDFAYWTKLKQHSHVHNNGYFRMNSRRLVMEYYLCHWLSCGCNYAVLKDKTWHIYHPRCCNVIVKAKCNKPHGITIQEYFSTYEQHRKKTLTKSDKNLLKYLAADTLFCEHCFEPFNAKNIRQDLITPFWALYDICSCFFFCILIWIPSLLCIGYLAIQEYIRILWKYGQPKEPKTIREQFIANDLQYGAPKSNHIHNVKLYANQHNWRL